MNYGLYISASGILTSMYRQDVYANNLANVETVGFKADTVSTRLRDPARVEDGLGLLPSNKMLETLGAGVLISPNRVAMTQGPLERTEDPMNLAIKGEGFLVVSTGSGSGEERFRLTRDGRLARRPDGMLVQSGTGALVMDDSDRPISLGATPITIDRDGTVHQDGGTVAKIQLTTVPDPTLLEKAGNNGFKISATAIASRRPAGGEIAQGHLERSAVDPIDAIMRFTNAAGDVAQSTKMIQMYDELMGRTINTFARVV